MHLQDFHLVTLKDCHAIFKRLGCYSGCQRFACERYLTARREGLRANKKVWNLDDGRESDVLVQVSCPPPRLNLSWDWSCSHRFTEDRETSLSNMVRGRVLKSHARSTVRTSPSHRENPTPSTTSTTNIYSPESPKRRSSLFTSAPLSTVVPASPWKTQRPLPNVADTSRTPCHPEPPRRKGASDFQILVWRANHTQLRS